MCVVIEPPPAPKRLDRRLFIAIFDLGISNDEMRSAVVEVAGAGAGAGAVMAATSAVAFFDRDDFTVLISHWKLIFSNCSIRLVVIEDGSPFMWSLYCRR